MPEGLVNGLRFANCFHSFRSRGEELMIVWWNKCSPSGLKEEICLTKALRLHIKGVLASEKVRFAVKSYMDYSAVTCFVVT